MRVLAAVDKFKGTATGAQVAAAIGSACWELGHDCVELPVADGGEGTLEALGGANRTSTVTGPLGDPVRAEWRLEPRHGGDRDGPGLRADAGRRGGEATTRWPPRRSAPAS